MKEKQTVFTIFWGLLVLILPSLCLSASGDKVWEFETDGHVRSSPVVSDGYVYIGSNDENVYCLNAETGDEEWYFITDNFVTATPWLSGDYVYIGSTDYSVYSIKTSNGREEWEFETDGQVRSSPIVEDDFVYVGSDDNKVYCLDADDGDKEWDFETDGHVRSSPAVSDGYVYVGSDDEKVYCLDADDGDKEWDFEADDDIESSPTVSDGYVYVGSDDGNVYCLDEDDGDKEWDYNTGNRVISSPTVSDGYVYVGSDDGRVYCLDADDGDKQWHFKTESQVRSSPTVSDGYVYVGSDDGNLYCLNADSGDKEWEFETGNYVRSSPVVSDGYVYFGSDDRKVYCLEAGVSEDETGSPIENNPPTVQITNPSNNEIFTKGENITFSGTAIDPEDGTLTGCSMVWTSSIDGQIGTGASFTRSDLFPGEHTITLKATDSQFLSSIATISITVLDNRMPIVQITTPLDNETFAKGEYINFSGAAIDPEDGPLTGDSLIWTSDLEGQIGTGTSFMKNNLSEDLHIVTLSAIDSGGLEVSDSIQIRIKDEGGEDEEPVKCPVTYFIGDRNPQLDNLRRIRDEVLTKNSMGKKLIAVYYENSSNMIAVCNKHPVVRNLTKKILKTFISVMEVFLE